MQNKTDKRTSLVSKSLPVTNLSSVSRLFSVRNKKCYVSCNGLLLFKQKQQYDFSLFYRNFFFLVSKGTPLASDVLIEGDCVGVDFTREPCCSFQTDLPCLRNAIYFNIKS